VLDAAVAAAGALLTVAGTGGYVVETARGSTKPRLVSWFTWTMILAIAVKASLDAHQWPSAILTLACATESATVFLLAVLRKDSQDRSVGWLDGVCLCGAVAGLVLLVELQEPSEAVVASVLTDLAAYLPTYWQGWTHPERESWVPYTVCGIGSGLLLLVVSWSTPAAYAYPVYLFAANTAAGLLVLIAGRKPGRGHQVCAT
jgi:hypothetical protein